MVFPFQKPYMATFLDRKLIHHRFGELRKPVPLDPALLGPLFLRLSFKLASRFIAARLSSNGRGARGIARKSNDGRAVEKGDVAFEDDLVDETVVAKFL